MEEQLITFETAKLAKEKGFTYAYEFYNLEGELEPWGMVGGWIDAHEKQYAAPTQALLHKWLRDKHKIYVGMYMLMNRTDMIIYHKCDISIMNLEIDRRDKILRKSFNTYETALEHGLLQALKLIK